MFEEIQIAMEGGTSDAVKMWMNWMGFIFLASVFFVWKHKPARFVLGAIVLTMMAGLITWALTENIHLLGIPHVLIWLPLAIYIWKNVLSKPAKANLPASPSFYDRAFFIWIGLVFATIAISLVFDVRDIFLVLTGNK